MNRFVLSLAAAALLFSAPAQASAEEGSINVNTAPQEVLAKVPGLSPELAKAIVSYREEMGDFMKIDELADVPGMTKENFDKARQALSVDAVSGAECNC